MVSPHNVAVLKASERLLQTCGLKIGSHMRSSYLKSLSQYWSSPYIYQHLTFLMLLALQTCREMVKIAREMLKDYVY